MPKASISVCFATGGRGELGNKGQVAIDSTQVRAYLQTHSSARDPRVLSLRMSRSPRPSGRGTVHPLQDLYNLAHPRQSLLLEPGWSVSWSVINESCSFFVDAFAFLRNRSSLTCLLPSKKNGTWDGQAFVGPTDVSYGHARVLCQVAKLHIIRDFREVRG